MKVSIEIKEISLKQDQQFVSENYPSSGFFKVENDGANAFFFVDKKSNIVGFMGQTNELPSFFKDIDISEQIESKQENASGFISEEFALKMLAISVGKVENIKI